jgi:hypothetical protein
MKGMRPSVRLSVLAPVIDPRALEIGVIAAMCPPLTEGGKKSIRRCRWAVRQIAITSNLPVRRLLTAPSSVGSALAVSGLAAKPETAAAVRGYGQLSE